MATIAENLASVRMRLAASCERAARDPGGVTLVAVTKVATSDEAAELYRLGVRHFGENRVMDGITRKNAIAAPDAVWHLIGHLQRNKAASALTGGFTRIHSVESLKLLDVLERECGKLGIKADILLEVNVSGEKAKYGVTPEDIFVLANKAVVMQNLRLRGLMTMAPFTTDPETSRPVFRELVRLREDLRQKLGQDLPELSMGMTGDFEVAVEEGATLVRIGTALFS
ncbi:MAG: YggS family pyridoxal phosphate-dependent enzyme [Planctomycetes bacterium]|nr:YggS family pyridoxal phosphate-dependent enzyme [Planctomycetota bacterium]